jgi:hypothetical protein
MLKEVVYHVPLMDLVALTMLINRQRFFSAVLSQQILFGFKNLQVIWNVYPRMVTTFHLKNYLPSVKVILRPHHQMLLRIDYSHHYQYQWVLDRPVLQLGGPESCDSVTDTVIS